MKKIVLILVLFLTFDNFAQDVSFGIKGGLNVAQTTRNKMDARIASHFGIMAEIKTSEQFSFQSEILYSAQGYAFNSTVSNRIHKFDYIGIPILFKYYLTEGLNLKIGPQFSFNIKAEEELEGSDSSVTNKLEGLRVFELGMCVGAAYRLSYGLNVGLRYNLGITDIYKVPLDINTPTRNSVLQFSVGYFF